MSEVGSKYKIVCTSCNEVKKMRPDMWTKRVKRYRSDKKLRESYLCRKCRR